MYFSTSAARASAVAIIGAGPAGLSLLSAFARAKKSGAKIPEKIVCFEKQSDWGGMWNFTWRTGLDEHGEPVHGSMYRNLKINAPKECYEYPDYSFDEHYGKPLPSYLDREVFRDYIVGRAQKANMRTNIQFNTAVRHVDFDEGLFNVRVADLNSGKEHTDQFDYAVVATSHFSVPNVPDFKGIEYFPGRVIHAHDFRDAQQFSGQNVLLIGSSYSAEDIALQIYRFGAKSATISYRTKPMRFKWPAGVEEVPLLDRIQDNVAYFIDGSCRTFDSIILCTGYKHNFPFIAEKLRLVSNNRLYPSQLYKGIVFQNQPRLMYLGMQDLYYTTTMFDIQAWYARDLILGRIPVPEEEKRAIDIKQWQHKEGLIKGELDAIHFQTAYLKDLLQAISDYPRLNLDAVAAMLEDWEHDKEESIVDYRKRNYASLLTGTKISEE